MTWHVSASGKAPPGDPPCGKNIRSTALQTHRQMRGLSHGTLPSVLLLKI
jgi:hypothetical protein